MNGGGPKYTLQNTMTGKPQKSAQKEQQKAKNNRELILHN
jgi:hypothetical protein